MTVTVLSSSLFAANFKLCKLNIKLCIVRMPMCAGACVCVCVCARVCVRAYVVYALRMVSMNKILCFTNTVIIF